MENVIENILKNDFVEYTKVYEIAALHGMTKKEIKNIKEKLYLHRIIYNLRNIYQYIYTYYFQDDFWKGGKVCLKSILKQ